MQFIEGTYETRNRIEQDQLGAHHLKIVCFFILNRWPTAWVTPMLYKYNNTILQYTCMIFYLMLTVTFKCSGELIPIQKHKTNM